MSAQVDKYTNLATFDTDSVLVGIDNRCSACISHDIDDFEGPLVDSNKTIKGFGGTRTTNLKMGTIVWNIEDNDGRIHKFTIPKSYYVPHGHVRLLSTQHWAKHTRNRHGSESRTQYDHIILSWDNGKSTRTVPLTKDTNVATMTLAPGFNKFKAFCTEAGITDEFDEELCYDTNVISDDEDDDESELWTKLKSTSVHKLGNY